MIFFNYNIAVLIEQYLGYLYKELSNLFNVLLWPLSQLYNIYIGSRLDMLYHINITSQSISIEGNLNKLYDPINKSIYIEDGNFDPMIYLPLDAAEGQEILFPLDAAEGQEVFFPLNEYERVGIVDFVVNVPATLLSIETQIAGTITNQKLAGKVFRLNYI